MFNSASSTPAPSYSSRPSSSPAALSLISTPGIITIPTDSSDTGISVDIPDTVRDSLPDDTSLNIVLVGGMTFIPIVFSCHKEKN